MTASGHKRIEILRGPFDPGGQPNSRTGHKLELGFFAWNIKGGMNATKAVLDDPDRLQNFWHWPNSMRLVQLAERAGFDYQVPYARWIGHGGETDYNGAALDFLATAAATAPVTSTLGLFSTAHVTFKFHPLHIAKFGASIDHISNGRWGLNIVTGYSAREQAAFGIRETLDHDVAYAMADEFVTLMKHYWHEPEPFDFEGEYYQSYGGYLAPKPTRKPRPILMNAGSSERGVDFAVRNCDWIFTIAPNAAGYASKVANIRKLAEGYGRTLNVATMCWVLSEATDALAQERLQDLVARIDQEAVDAFLDSMRDNAGFELIKKSSDRFALGLNSPQLVGSSKTIAEQLLHLHEQGIDSVLLGFFDPQKGLHQMQDEIVPLLRKMGLRN